MKRIVITGGSGFLCYELVRELLNYPDIRLAVTTSRVREVSERFRKFDVEIICNEDFLAGKDSVDCLVHTAFCRQDNGDKLAESLELAGKVFSFAAKNTVPIINISSQAVYGMGRRTELPTESCSVCPEYSYAVAKAAEEILLESVMYNCKNKAPYTNIRLAALIGPGYSIPRNITYKFILNALHGNEIRIIGGKQKFSFLDVRDAAQALGRMITAPRQWETIYNLGHIGQTDIVYMAELVNDCIALAGRPKVPIKIKEEDIFINAGMDSSRFYRDFSWKPQYSLKDTIMDCISILCRDCGEQIDRKRV